MTISYKCYHSYLVSSFAFRPVIPLHNLQPSITTEAVQKRLPVIEFFVFIK